MSWNISKLGEECKIFSGNSINAKTKESLYTNVEGTPYIATKDITYDGNINYLNGVSIPEENQDKFRKAKSESVFICAEGGSAGRKIAFSDTECFFVNKLFCLEAGSNLLPKYIYYYLRSEAFQIQFKNALTGLIGGVSLSKIKLFDITYPSLPVQKQIVEKLDVVFADIGKAISATEKNIENAEALFQSYLNQIFETKGEGWESSTIEEAFMIKPPKSEFKEIPLNSQVSFMGMNKLGINQKYSIPEEVRDLEKVFKNYTYFSENDVLLAKITPCFENGKLGIAKELKNGIGFGSSEFVVLRTKSSISNEWLYYFLLRDEFRESGKKVMTGAVGHKRVPKEFIEKSVINFPKLKSQEYIITNFESLQEKTSKLKELSKDKINNLIALKSSLLNQAFSGELTKDAA